MEIQLQELIDQIKKDGVEAAEGEAASIIEEARAEASRIVEEAKAEADRIVRDASEESARFTRVSEEAIRQAGRNVLISFRESVTKELSAVTGEKIKAAYSADVLSDLVPKAVEAWAKSSSEESLTVLLNSGDLEQLEGALLGALKERALEGITLKSDDSFEGGFRISVSDGAAYYDYSAEEVTKLMSSYLNPKVTALLKEAGRA